MIKLVLFIIVIVLCLISIIIAIHNARYIKRHKKALMRHPDYISEAKRRVDLIIQENAENSAEVYRILRDALYNNRDKLYFQNMFVATMMCEKFIREAPIEDVRKEHLVRVFANMRSSGEFEETFKNLGLDVNIYKLHIIDITLCDEGY